jgi:hypothetical protein
VRVPPVSVADNERLLGAERAELEANVKKSLDEILGDMKIKPPL